MIVRILGDGQYDLPDSALDDINQLDAALEQSVQGDDEIGFRGALAGLLSAIRDKGSRVPDDSLEPSDAIVPGDDAHADEVRQLLTEEGIIPG
jgi:hypothetical protein